MSRKTQMSMWKDGHRRSPRISALDAWKAHKEKDGGVNVSQNSIQVMPMEHNGLGPPSRTRARKKRKLRPVQDVAVSSVTATANQGSESPVDEDHPVNSDQQSVFQAKESTKHEGQSLVVSSAEWLPEKHTLELILDTLQRRDTHEIFAEPVDPEEVEDYYEIIKEPMDFGTMRAKLHEGMYKNLEQFEHDVFLISSNAMHFNSSSTIYFRQARALQELSKKVFHVLKTDPRNFELEFSATRRRPGRRPPGDARGSNFSSPPKPMTNARSRSMTYDGSSKGIRSLSSPLSLRKTIRANPGYPDTATHFETGDPEILSGSGDGKSNLSETEQRCTYRPWTSFFIENESIVSTIYSYPRALLHVNQCDKGYTESLTMFVKDLGPVAQMVAKKKLQGWWPDEPNCPTSSSNHWFQAPKCENPAAGILDIENTTRTENSLYQIRGPATHVLNSSSGGMDLAVADKGVRADTNVTMANSSAREEVAPNIGAKSIQFGGRGRDGGNNRMNFPVVLGGDTVHRKQSAEIQLASYSSTHAGDLNSSFDGMMITGSKLKPIHTAGKLDHQVQPLVLSSEPSQSNMFEKFSWKKVNTVAPPPSWPLQTTKETPASSHTTGSLNDLGLQYLSNDGSGTAAPPPKFTGSAQAGLIPVLNQPKPLVPQFIFDLPFLRSQLSQMNSSGQTGMQRNSTAEGPFSEIRSHERASMSAPRAEPSPRPSHGSQQHTLLDSKPTDLALQL